MIFYGRKPVTEMPKYYAMADAMLVTMIDNPVISRTLPGKVQTYMATGKPIIGAISGETNNIIVEAQCGFCGKAEDEKELAKNVERYIKYENKEKLRQNSVQYYREHFLKADFMNKLLIEIRTIK